MAGPARQFPPTGNCGTIDEDRKSGPYYVFDKVCKGDTMRKFSSPAVVLALVASVSLATAGCSQIGRLKGMMAFKDANTLYRQQDYRGATAKYEDALAGCAGGADCTDPMLVASYFYLANSYDNLYRPGKRGEAANDAQLTKAIDNYKKSAALDANPATKTLALQYLVNAFGPDKLNDPSQSEPILQQMIQMDPKDPANYFVLAGIYEQNGDYEMAEATLLKARAAKPSDSNVFMQLAGFYNRQGEFPKTIEALQQRASNEPNNPEAFYTMATYYWDKAYRDFRLPEAEKVKYVQSGVDAVDKAISLKGDYVEALVYKNLLLRLQANLEKSPARQQALLKEADTFRNRAEELRKQKAAAPVAAPGRGAGRGE
jgi:predicted Zn-dependent protease